MRLAIMQPYFFPYLGYFQLLQAADQFVFYDDVAFIKNGWINRNRILLDGAPHWFTVPVRAASSHVSIDKTRIALDESWRAKLLKTLAQAYGGAPYFAAVQPLVARVLAEQDGTAADLAERSVTAVAGVLKLSTSFHRSSRLDLSPELRGQARVIAVCRVLGATEYVNPVGGGHLYEGAAFSAAGIRLRLLRPESPEYPQPASSFVPNLSVLDALMFNAPEQVAPMTRRGTLL